MLFTLFIFIMSFFLATLMATFILSTTKNSVKYGRILQTISSVLLLIILIFIHKLTYHRILCIQYRFTFLARDQDQTGVLQHYYNCYNKNAFTSFFVVVVISFLPLVFSVKYTNPKVFEQTHLLLQTK